MFIVVIATLLVACAPQTAPQGLGGGSGDPVSWWDAPLPGTIVDPGSPDVGLPAIQLVSHHSDSSGIAEIEFSVNGVVVETNPGPPDTEALVTDMRDWTPPGSGEYELRVRAKSKTGTWGNYAETYVVVPDLEDLLLTGGVVQGAVYAGLSQSPLEGVQVTLEGCGLSQSQMTAGDGAFNFAGLPVGSCLVSVFKQDWGFVSSIPDLGQYPLPVASDPNLPTAFSIIMDITNPFPEQQAGLSERGLDTNIVYTGTCSPNNLNFSIRAVHPDGIRGVTFFFRLRSENGDTTSWSNGDAMTPLGDDYYALAMTGNHLESDSGFDQATVLYQFVIEPIGGQSSDFVRSEVFSDVTLVACGEAPPPPPPPPPLDEPTPYPCLPYPSCLVH
jgi:hypothetical protein